MRMLPPALFLITLAAFACADTPAVTTAPAVGVSELQQLRAQVKYLQAENQLLREQIAALSPGAPAVQAPVTAAADPDEKPLDGIEGILDGFPKEQMPGINDAAGGLRHTLLTQWVQQHAPGRMITLHARFADASGISGGHFTVRIGSGISHQMPHPFEASIVLNESDAPTVVPLHRLAWVVVNGRVKSADVTRDQDGAFVVLLTIDHATIMPDLNKPR